MRRALRHLLPLLSLVHRGAVRCGVHVFEGRVTSALSNRIEGGMVRGWCLVSSVGLDSCGEEW